MQTATQNEFASFARLQIRESEFDQSCDWRFGLHPGPLVTIPIGTMHGWGRYSSCRLPKEFIWLSWYPGYSSRCLPRMATCGLFLSPLWKQAGQVKLSASIIDEQPMKQKDCCSQHLRFQSPVSIVRRQRFSYPLFPIDKTYWKRTN